jgi:hypothetical protein
MVVPCGDPERKSPPQRGWGGQGSVVQGRRILRLASGSFTLPAQ